MPAKKQTPEFAGAGARQKDRAGVQAFQGLLTMIQGLPLALQQRFQEDKEALFDDGPHTRSCSKRWTILNRGRGSASAPSGWRASAGGRFSMHRCADYLVARGVPFPGGLPAGSGGCGENCLGRKGCCCATCPWSAGSCCNPAFAPTSTPPSPAPGWVAARPQRRARISQVKEQVRLAACGSAPGTTGEQPPIRD